jgi:transcriptional regulator with XRE-family HTH domain
MPARERRVERASWLIEKDLRELGNDLRSARLAAGLTLREVASRLGVAPSTILGNERAEAPGARPELLARHAGAVGLRLRIKSYPEGEPLRDSGSVRLIGAFRGRLPTLRFRPEVPVSAALGDQRAWDGVIELPGCRCATEFVTRFHDCQAQLRAFELKLRDGSVDRLILVVLASHANRRALALARVVVDAAFPLGTRAVMAALAAGRDPGANGIVLISPSGRATQGGTPNA